MRLDLQLCRPTVRPKELNFHAAGFVHVVEGIEQGVHKPDNKWSKLHLVGTLDVRLFPNVIWNRINIKFGSQDLAVEGFEIRLTKVFSQSLEQALQGLVSHDVFEVLEIQVDINRSLHKSNQQDKAPCFFFLSGHVVALEFLQADRLDIAQDSDLNVKYKAFVEFLGNKLISFHQVSEASASLDIKLHAIVDTLNELSILLWDTNLKLVLRILLFGWELRADHDAFGAFALNDWCNPLLVLVLLLLLHQQLVDVIVTFLDVFDNSLTFLALMDLKFDKGQVELVVVRTKRFVIFVGQLLLDL